MSSSIRLGRIFGIPIFLHITFLVILPIFVWTFSEGTGTILGIPVGFGNLDSGVLERYAFGTAASVLFFATILVHELAHSYLALNYGVQIKSITLMLFGGVAAMEDIPRKPGQELRMAFAGPMSSLGIGLVSYILMLALETVRDPAVAVEGITILLGLIALYNLLLAGFNMIPAFPMDGGRVLRSYLATRMPYVKATETAAKVGRYAAIGMGILGILFFNVWLILIAFFVYVGATEEEQATVTMDALSGMTVRNIMTDAVQVVHPSMSLQQLMDIMFYTKHTGFPVVDRGVVGLVTLADTHKVSRERLPYATVAEVMTREFVSVTPDMPAAAAFALMSEKKATRLLVLYNGMLVGIVTPRDIERAVHLANARRRGGGWTAYPPAPPTAPPPSPPPSPPTASS